MLLQVNITNFLSIKNEVILTAFANTGKEHSDYLLNSGDDKVLPVIAMYGGNAAGKTNIIKAFTCAIMLVRRSNNLQINMPTGFEPFLFDDDAKNRKTKMDFLFTHNGKKFSYGFVADYQYIYEEYLYEYKSSRPTMIFERSEISKYKFTAAYKHLSEFQYKNTSNKLFMCTATAWNCEETRDAYLWFAEGIDTYDYTSFQGNQIFEYLNQHNDKPETKSFLLSLLNHAEINIQDYEFEVKSLDSINHSGLDNVQTIFPMVKQYRLDTIHNIEQSDGTVKPFKLPFLYESEGTRLLFAYGPIIMDAFEKGRTIVIDELDKSLHPNLEKYLIGLFNDKSINKGGAQLIFNSHDVDLLDLDLFRRDQIYFVEKDNRTGITDLYSLADFSPRKSENIQKGYLQGRYGAIPFPDGGVEW